MSLNRKSATVPLLLELKNITVLRNKRKILNAVSLKIAAGENVAILGPNGAGKSSLIKIITREYYPVLDPQHCLFRIWGQGAWDVFELRRLLGVVTNDLQFACARDIWGMEVVLSGYFSSIGLFNERVTSAMKRKAKRIVEFLEIAHLSDRKMNAMSSGEARRFLIGRALVHDPKALVLDEPTSSLDLHAQYRFSTMLRKISAAGTSIILVTHNLSDIIPEINRVVLMKQGRFFQEGPKEMILTDKNISKLFGSSVAVREKDGYYYALRA